MNIEIWSDIVCPFCYIGKTKLDMAIKQVQPKIAPTIVWKSYQLDPDAPLYSDGDIYDYLAERKGVTREQSILMHKNVSTMAEEVGLTYNFDRVKVANSASALRMVKLATSLGKGNEMKMLLFYSYFTEGRHISDHQTLTELGESLDISYGDIKECLESDRFSNQLNADIMEAREIGIRGVPFFLFDRKLAISGAHDVSTFVQALEQASQS